MNVSVPVQCSFLFNKCCNAACVRAFKGLPHESMQDMVSVCNNSDVSVLDDTLLYLRTGLTVALLLIGFNPVGEVSLLLAIAANSERNLMERALLWT